jgi:hypothetical protein
MGHQEMLIRAKNTSFEKFKRYIRYNKGELENPPYDYCKVAAIMTYKRDVEEPSMMGWAKLFKEDDTFLWVTGQRSAVNWLSERIEETTELEIEQIPIELVADCVLKDFRGGRFENEYIISEPFV